ncbi:MAG: RNA-binding protein [Candidatus Hecatellales archaeon]|nr:MAG: RNA-binding protein [Candidatus Hecatellales archaeon]
MSDKLKVKRGQDLVTPGDRLGVIEEFQAGRGTYTEKGVIYSRTLGKVVIDLKRKRISVQPKTRVPPIPRKGSIIIGEVQQVQDKMATVKVLSINGEKLNRPYTAIIHVSYAVRGFLKSLHDAFRPGDLIKASIIGVENLPYQLTTAGRNLGVIKAYCTRCGGSLTYRKNRKILECEKCGKTERRKVSEEYDVI